MECEHQLCQVCSFISDSEDCTVRATTVDEVLNGQKPMPFTSRISWKKAQQDCPALRRTYAHLSQGTRPCKKDTRVKDIRLYLGSVSLSKDGLIVVKKATPFTREQELIVIPRALLDGVLTALHLRMLHPSKTQMMKAFHRYFYALDADVHIQSITSSCPQCAALARLPREVVEYTTSPDPPKSPGTTFACDVMCRAKQKIFVLRDCFSSYTRTKLIEGEDKLHLRDAIIELSADLKVNTGVVIRVDGATAFQALVGDTRLSKHGITLEVGRLKNINKNPVAERAVGELAVELKKEFPDGGPISSAALSVVTAVLNSRIRNRGLSAKEILFQRDNDTLVQLNFSDQYLSDQQHDSRTGNHLPSARSKAPKGKVPEHVKFSPGDLVFIKSDGTKHTARERYMVSSCVGDFVYVKKLLGSQFRTKEYKVKNTELYSVPYRTDAPLSSEWINTSDPYADPDEEDCDITPTAVYDEHTDVVNDGNNNVPPEPIVQRPQRQRRRPAWMDDDNWVLE